jgi:hypothetical protein
VAGSPEAAGGGPVQGLAGVAAAGVLVAPEGGQVGQGGQVAAGAGVVAGLAGRAQALAGAGLGRVQPAGGQLDRGQVLQRLREQPDRAVPPRHGHGPGEQGVAGLVVADEEGGGPGPQQPPQVLDAAGQGDGLAQQRLAGRSLALGDQAHALEEVAEELALLVGDGHGGGPPAALGVVAGECGHPLQRGRGRGVAVATAGPVGRALQLGRGGLVGSDGGRGQVPGPLVGGVLAGQDVGQGPVGGLPGREGGRPVGGRADQGMAELEPAVAGPDQPGRLAPVEGAGADPEAGAGAQHDRRVAGGLGRRDQQQRARVGGQAPDPLAEGPFQPGGEREHVVQGRPPGQLVGLQRPWQLQQGQRVAAGPLDQPVDLRRGQLGAGPDEQGRRGLRVEPAQAQLGQAGGRELARVAVAGGEQQHHPLGLKTAGGEPQHLGRRAVQPLGLVDQAEHRPVLGRLGQQAEHGHRHEKPVPAVRGTGLAAPAGGGEAEGAGERGRLGLGEAPGQLQDRPQELVQGGERQLGLGLDAGGPEHGHPLGPPGGMLEQGGLADTALADGAPALRCATGGRRPAAGQGRRTRRVCRGASPRC